MNIFNSLQAGITLFLSVIPWFLPDCAWYIKAIILFCVLLCSLLLSCVRLSSNLKTVSQELQELKKRHDALANLYDEKLNHEKHYRLIMNNMSIMFHIAIANTDHAKIAELYNFFLIMQKEMSGGISDE